MNLTMIVAMDKHFGIGIDNTIPWKCKADVKHFREYTMGKPCIMGRNTFKSIGKPLQGRLNIVLSSKITTEDYHLMYEHENLCFADNVLDALRATSYHYKDKAEGYDAEVVVIGGKQVYEALLPFCDNLLVSWISGEYECDTDLKDLWNDKVNTDFVKDPNSAIFLDGCSVWNYIRYYKADTNDFIRSLTK